MRCLHCGKTIKNPTDAEQASGWHERCVKKFFGTSELPEIELTDEALKILAERSVAREFTVPGVQKKLSLHLSKKNGVRLTLVDYPSGYILKPQTAEYENLPEFEHTAMLMAEACGIRTVPHALMEVDGRRAYITKRVDRSIQKDVKLFAMEDFCQLSGRLTSDKYRGSYEKCGRIICRYSAFTGLDLSEFFLRVVFSFAIGNSDMHLKNFSLIENTPAAREYRLSPAYDMLPVNVILPTDPDQMALTVNGKRRNIHRKDFLILADRCGITRKAAENILNSVKKNETDLHAICEQSLLKTEEKKKVNALIEERMAVL